MRNARFTLAISILSSPLTLAQLITSLPGCIQNCVEQSPDTNCGIADIGCLCRASAGNFLTDTVICIKGNCDNNLDPDILLAPMQFACQLAGAPIPDSAIKNAESAANTAQPATMTVTISPTAAEATNTGVVTVTETQGGSTATVVYPVTEWRTTTVTGAGSTITSLSVSGSVSTYTTTDSSGASTTVKTTKIGTSTQNSSSSSDASSTTGSTEPTTLTTTTLAAQDTSSSVTTAKPTTSTSSSSNNDASNSAPFKDSNSAGRVKATVENWLGLSILLAVGIAWF